MGYQLHKKVDFMFSIKIYHMEHFVVYRVKSLDVLRYVVTFDVCGYFC